MRYKGTPREALQLVLEPLELAADGYDAPWVLVADAVDQLLPLTLILQQQPGLAPPYAELEATQRHVGDLLRQIGNAVLVAPQEFEVAIEDDPEIDSYTVALRRSGMQLLHDWFPDGGFVTDDDLAAIDQAIETYRQEHDPVESERVPDDLPPGHARWWR